MSCPTPQKAAFTSERQAKAALRSIKNPHGTMHAYRCGGHWHLGHHTFVEKDKPRRRPIRRRRRRASR